MNGKFVQSLFGYVLFQSIYFMQGFFLTKQFSSSQKNRFFGIQKTSYYASDDSV